MLDIKFIRENLEKVQEGAQNKGVKVDVKRLLELDSKRRQLLSELQNEQTVHNRSSVLSMAPTKKVQEKLLEQKKRIVDFEKELEPITKEYQVLLRQIPNIPLDSVPVGKDESENVILREVGEKPNFGFTPKDYIELGTITDVIDTERAAKVSGSRFGYLKHEGPLLELALVQYAMHFVTNERNLAEIIKERSLSVSPKPFIPVIPPVLVKPEAMEAMGYVERGSDEIYYLEKDDLYLVGTSEQSVGPMHRDETFDREQLPHRHIAFSTCFRREAGSYGKDTRGILRVHQFDKVEMFSVTTPETSRDEHELLLGIEEKLMQGLELPYRVLSICTGDLGDPAAAKYDIETWLPGQRDKQGEYRETHSTSNTTDFQSRRLNVKVRLPAQAGRNGETEFVHMLNGTTFAIGRMIIAILENYQTAEGTVRIPKVLQPYMGDLKEIKR